MNAPVSQGLVNGGPAGADEARRGRLLAGTCKALGAAALVVACLGAIVEGGPSPRVGALLLFTAACAGAPALLRRVGRLGPPTHLVAAGGVVVLATNAFTLGGLHSATLTASLLITTATFFFAGQRVAAVWTGVCGGVIAAYYLFERSGRALPMALAPDDDALMSAVSMLVQLAAAFYVASLYERERRRSAAALAQALDELAAANADLLLKNRDLHYFTQAAAHDLRAPLRNIAGFADLLVDGKGGELPEKAARWAGHIGEGVRRMQALLDSLAAYISAGQAPVVSEGFALGDAAADALANLRAQVEETGADVRCEGLPRVLGDRMGVVTVLQNLLSNAMSYAGGAPPEVRVGASADGLGWVVEVSDNGPGMDSTLAEHCFDAFRRLPGSEGVPGSGLGLALAKRVVERWGGAIGVDTAPGRGARFWFTIRSARSVSAEVRSPAAGAGGSSAAGAT